SPSPAVTTPRGGQGFPRSLGATLAGAGGLAGGGAAFLRALRARGLAGGGAPFGGRATGGGSVGLAREALGRCRCPSLALQRAPGRARALLRWLLFSRAGLAL